MPLLSRQGEKRFCLDRPISQTIEMEDFKRVFVFLIKMSLCHIPKFTRKIYSFEKYQPVWVSLSTFSEVFAVSKLTITIARIAITNA